MAQMVSLSSVLRSRLEQARAAVAALDSRTSHIEALMDAVRSTLVAGGTLFTCGNGGSAAEALHLAEELTGRYRSNRRPLRSICLCADPTALTCIANDFGFEQVFARPLSALGRPGDALVVFSTSGRSANLVAALHAARSQGMRTIGLLGGDGGACLPLCDVAVTVSGVDGAAVQEAHQVVMHAICEALEDGAPPRA
jgi:D-sedoheptulose 7-phosphate isomerase